jgi:hypothetical protein
MFALSVQQCASEMLPFPARQSAHSHDRLFAPRECQLHFAFDSKKIARNPNSATRCSDLTFWKPSHAVCGYELYHRASPNMYDLFAHMLCLVVRARACLYLVYNWVNRLPIQPYHAWTSVERISSPLWECVRCESLTADVGIGQIRWSPCDRLLECGTH